MSVMVRECMLIVYVYVMLVVCRCCVGTIGCVTCCQRFIGRKVQREYLVFVIRFDTKGEGEEEE